MFILISSTTLVWNIFHSKKNCARYDQKCTLVVMYTNLYSCQISVKLEFPRILENSSCIIFRENPFNGSRFVPCIRTDMHEKRTSSFRIFMNAPKIGSILLSWIMSGRYVFRITAETYCGRNFSWFLEFIWKNSAIRPHNLPNPFPFITSAIPRYIVRDSDNFVE